MAYVYRGTIRDVEEIPTPPRSQHAGRAPYDPSKCGTYAGYKQHQSHKTTPCQPCKDATAKYMRDLRERHKLGRVERIFRDDKCGTLAGYSRHKRHKVPICDECRQARSEHRREHYRKYAA